MVLLYKKSQYIATGGAVLSALNMHKQRRLLDWRLFVSVDVVHDDLVAVKTAIPTA